MATSTRQGLHATSYPELQRYFVAPDRDRPCHRMIIGLMGPMGQGKTCVSERLATMFAKVAGLRVRLVPEVVPDDIKVLLGRLYDGKEASPALLALEIETRFCELRAAVINDLLCDDDWDIGILDAPLPICQMYASATLSHQITGRRTVEDIILCAARDVTVASTPNISTHTHDESDVAPEMAGKSVRAEFAKIWTRSDVAKVILPMMHKFDRLYNNVLSRDHTRSTTLFLAYLPTDNGVDETLRRIVDRARNYEGSVSHEYMCNIHTGYMRQRAYTSTVAKLLGEESLLSVHWAPAHYGASCRTADDNANAIYNAVAMNCDGRSNEADARERMLRKLDKSLCGFR